MFYFVIHFTNSIYVYLKNSTYNLLISNACQNLAHIKIINFKESHSYLDTYAIKSKIKRLSDSVELKKAFNKLCLISSYSR